MSAGALNFTVKVNAHDVEIALQDLGYNAPLAAKRALDRTIAKEATETVRAMAENLKIAQKFIRAALVVKRATLAGLTASLEVTGRRIPLIAFNARGPRPSRGRGTGVSYDVGQGRKVAAHAFIARMRSGHEGVYLRKGKARLPIRELLGPSLPLIFTRPGIRAIQQRIAETELIKQLKHEAEFILRGGRRAA